MAEQNALSLQIPIIPDQVAALTDLLNTSGNPQKSGSFFPFEKIPTVHFARWIIVPAGTTTKGKRLPASLVYSSNVDGSADQHIEDIAEIVPDGLDQILSHCTGYPDEASRNRSSRIQYLRNYQLSTAAFYVGAPNRTVEQIHNEAKLHTAVHDYVKDNEGKWSTSKEAYDEIKNFLAQDSQWDWARGDYQLPRKSWLRIILLVLLLLISLPVILIFALLIQLFYEKRSKSFGLDINQVPEEHMSRMKSQEDFIYHNQLSAVFETKSGLRKLGLHFFLWLTNLLAKSWFVEGHLVNTPTIHFARWVMIDDGLRFVFLSNFDGSHDMYLGDFADNNGWGLNTVYGGSVGYCKTFFIVGKGAYLYGEFKGWSRYTQVESQTWYSAYPWYGLQQIVDRTHLRTELCNFGTLNEAEIKQTLRRI